MSDPKSCDSAYKTLFSHKSIFHQFLTRFVDEEIFKDLKVNDLQLIDQFLISDEIKREESDVIYRVKVATDQPWKDTHIYVITEFQSKVDKSIPIQLHQYILKLYYLMLRNGHEGKLPPIFPIVLYYGTEPWTIPDNINAFRDHLTPPEYVPSFSYYCMEERNISEEQAKQLGGVYAAITIANKQKNKEFPQEMIDILLDLVKDDDDEALRAFTSYLRNVFGHVLGDEGTE